MNEEILPAWILKELQDWHESKRYGYIQLNFNNGIIINLNKHETLKEQNVSGYHG